MKIKGIALLILLLSGCVMIHPGNYARQINPTGIESKKRETNLGLIVSGIENSSLSSKYFGVIEFTFENKSQEWIRINNIKVDFGDERIDKHIKFTSGKDLAVWYESTQKRNAIQNANNEIAMGFLAGIGAGMAVGSKNQNIKDFGSGLAIGAAASLSAYEFNKYLKKIEGTEIFPENHLFASDFIIPPGLFVKKWLLLNSENHKEIGKITNLFLEYQTDNDKTERLKLTFRYQGISKWQSIY